MHILSTWNLTLLTLLPTVLAADILKTDGFSDCGSSSTITVNNVDVSFDRSTDQVTFDVSGSSSESQDVTATLTVTAYGKQVYEKEFDPCDAATKVDQLCPVPAGTFSASGTYTVPSSYVSDIPAIAFSIPDLEGQVTLLLKARDGGQSIACIQSDVSNGKTVEVPAVSYAAASVAAGALALSGLGAFSAAGHPGASGPSPQFGEVLQWMQGIALNGMLSVNYPPIYRSFTKNFAFSTGLFPWDAMQTSIDNFRAKTGGNLTGDSVAYLRNATLVYSDGSNSTTTSSLTKRSGGLFLRAIDTSVNGTTSGSSNSMTSGNTKVTHLVQGVQGFVEQLTIPQANTFMTVLLVFSILIAAIAVGILLFKVILEAWALFYHFPLKLATFRKDYWMIMARTIVNLILLLYGVWVLYCIFQFTHGDSWAAKVLAGVTLAAFTAILAFYTFRIWLLATRFKNMEGDESALYENKETWKRYKLFYENYKRGYWWLFMPSIIYMFAKGCVVGAGDGHGLFQTIGSLVIEMLMLILLLWSRPYNLKSGNWINIIIQIARVLSVGCILVFVEQLGIVQSTRTITGVVLIGLQGGLTAVVAILIAANSIIVCFRENPHRKRRKQAEQLNMHRDLDDLTPFDGRDSLMLEPTSYKRAPQKLISPPYNKLGFEPYRGQGPEGIPPPRYAMHRDDSQDHLVSSAASMSGRYAPSRRSSRDSWVSEASRLPMLAPVERQDHVTDFINDRRL